MSWHLLAERVRGQPQLHSETLSQNPQQLQTTLIYTVWHLGDQCRCQHSQVLGRVLLAVLLCGHGAGREQEASTHHEGPILGSVT